MDTKDYSIIGISTLLLISLGLNILPDDTHYCEDLELSMHCDRLSSTEKTCYPKTDTTKGKKYCSSKWINIVFEQESTETPKNNKGEQFKCNTDGECIKLK